MQIVKVASEREVRFYERVAAHSAALLSFVPHYYGILQVDGECDDLRRAVQRQLQRRSLQDTNLSPWTLQVLQKEVKVHLQKFRFFIYSCCIIDVYFAFLRRT